MKAYTLAELAQKFELELKGEGATVIKGVCALTPGKPDHISFLANPKLRDQLALSSASAVIVGKRDVQALQNGLIAPDATLAYARIAALFDPYRDFPVDVVHPSAVIAVSAKIGKGCCIGPNVVIAEGAVIGDGCFIGPNSVIGQKVQMGAGTQLASSVFIWHDVRIGERCNFQPGAVIGSRGFGNARGPKGWEEIPQLGTVIIGDDVEVGANTCIDRGALGDTIIGNGVKLDNLIQIAHNVQIGEHTAIAANTGIAGSTRIGSRCMIGGASTINGHIEIADDVILLGGSSIANSVTKGIYGPVIPSGERKVWRRTIGHINRLDNYAKRLREIEKKLNIERTEDDDAGDPDA